MDLTNIPPPKKKLHFNHQTFTLPFINFHIEKLKKLLSYKLIFLLKDISKNLRKKKEKINYFYIYYLQSWIANSLS